MRFLSINLAFLAVLLISACDFWPRDLKPLAESISQQLSGEATAWLVSGDVMLIDVAGSPSYWKAPPELQALATGIAKQAIAFAAAPLESIMVTFHEAAVTEDPKKMQEFIFLVVDNRPILQPLPDLDATGPLTLEDFQIHLADRMDQSLSAEQRECVVGKVEKLARNAGDPETLDLTNVKFLSSESWYALDAFGKRLILGGAIMTEALFECH